jgi:hypothetical protein
MTGHRAGGDGEPALPESYLPFLSLQLLRLAMLWGWSRSSSVKSLEHKASDEVIKSWSRDRRRSDELES